MISFDLETAPIARARLAPPIVCMSYHRGGQDPELVTGQDVIHALVRSWLSSDQLLIGQNVAYDWACLAQAYPDMLPDIMSAYDSNRIESIDVNQKIADIAREGSLYPSYALDALATRHGFPAMDKTTPWRLEFQALAHVPVAHWPAGAREYVLGDATAPTNIWLKQVQAYGRSPLAGAEARKAFVLHLISCWGLRTDPGRTRALARYLDRYSAKLKSRLVRHGLVRASGKRDTKAAERAMQATGSKALTDSGALSLDKEACDASGSGALRMYSAYSQTAGLRARVADLEQGTSMPLQTRFQSLLETSRTSSSKPSLPLVGVQVQNFPRKAGARECLIPRPGHVFVSADLPSAELRSLAQVCVDRFGRSVMADQLNAGRDLHLWFGGQVLGIEYEQALARADDPLVKKARQNAKPCNFGFPGGMGVTSFIEYAWKTYRVRFTEAEGKRLKHMWLRAFPEMAEFFDWIGSLLCLDGTDRASITHLRSGRVRGRVTYCQACNSQFQELTATAASEGLCRASRACYTDMGTALFGSRPVLYAHDEIVLETPEMAGHEAAMELSRVMAEAFTEWHPHVPAVACTGPGKDARAVVPCVSRRYSKDMRSVWSGNRLQAWECT